MILELPFEETKRSELPDSSFGIPEDRKFPLDTKKHVSSAIKLFGHAEESKKKTLAKRISSAAKQYNITIPETSQVYKYLNEAAIIMEEEMEEEPQASKKDTILVNRNNELETFDIKHIHHWHISEKRYAGDLDESNYYKTLTDAINNTELTGESEFIYVYICNGNRRDLEDHCKPILVGLITLDEDKCYEWKIQYPVTVRNGVYSGMMDEKDNEENTNEDVEEDDAVNEYSMAAMNPIKGTTFTKPYIIKMNNEFDETINARQYLLSPDVVSDKYFAISEDATIKVIDAKKVNKNYIEAEYEYIGDKHRLSKIFEAYKSGKIVDNTFFYTALTNKPMLTEDQIDFDYNFKKVNFDKIKYNTLSELSTNLIKFNKYTNNYDLPLIDFPFTESVNSSLYRTKKNEYGLQIKYSLSGLCVYSESTDKYSAFVESVNDITDTLIESVLTKFGGDI